MTDQDGLHSDDELDKAVKDGKLREGYARVHHKLFPKYGFLIPEEPMFIGETIFFGITAHVEASKRYIADLRDELKPDQRVQYMAVPQDREGVIKWKGMVVSPLSGSYPSSQTSEDSIEENKQWLTCKVLPNLQPHRGFATPLGGNQYSDNVYFTTREVSDGLDVLVSDLRLVLNPGEVIKALVVSADPRYKAKYKALKITKVHGNAINNQTSTPKSDQPLVEERDRGAVSWIYSVLKSKGSAKISKLVGNLSNHQEVRAVVQPQKKSLKKFLSKYPKFFCIKDNVAMLDQSCPPLLFDTKVDRSLKSINDNDWSDSSDSDESSSGEESARESTPSPVPYSAENLKAVAQFSSRFTVSMLASIIKSLPDPPKMLELYRICQQRGWEGMVSVAMIAQVVSNNPEYFKQDSKSCIVLTREGSQLSVKRVGEALKAENSQSSRTEFAEEIQQRTPMALSLSVFPTSDFDPNLAHATYHYQNKSIFSPIDNNPLGGSPYQPYGSLLSGSGTKSLPSSHGDAEFGNGNVYHSDPEDSIEERQRNSQPPGFSEEENRFLSVVASGVFPRSPSVANDVFAMLKKELDNLGITQSDSDTDRSSAVLASHLLCIQMDVGSKPKAIFKHFTPSGKITQSKVTLPAEKVTLPSLDAMVNSSQPNLGIAPVGKRLYGIDKTYHCIRIMETELKAVMGCTVSFRSQEAGDVGTPDLLDLGERKKVKILLTNPNGSNSSSSTCKTLRKYAQEKCAKSAVAVIDMEGQIFGFGLPVSNIQRMICSSLDAQQHFLKDVVHHHASLVVVNSIDCEDSLKLLMRISTKGIAVFAEVSKSLESNVRKIFDSKI